MSRRHPSGGFENAFGYASLKFIGTGLEVSLRVSSADRFFFFVFCLFRATPEAHGGFQVRGQVGAVAAGLHHSHSHARSEPCLQPTPQLTAMPDL